MRWAMRLILLVVIAGASHGALANSVSTCINQEQAFYKNTGLQMQNTINQGEPALGAVSSCLRSLIDMFHFDVAIYAPDLFNIIANYINQVCAATRGQITGVLGGGQITVQPPVVPPIGGGGGGGGIGGGGGGGAGGGGTGGGGSGGGGVVVPPGGGGGGAPPKSATNPGIGAPPAATQGSIWNKLLSRYGPPSARTSKSPGSGG